MNKKYERYINFIVSDIKPPYFKNMVEMYGLKDSEYELVLSKVYNQPVIVRNNDVYDSNGNELYRENSNGSWYKYEYDANGDLTYFEDSDGDWKKYEYDANGNDTYHEDSNGNWYRREYNEQGREVYYVDSYGDISDRR